MVKKRHQGEAKALYTDRWEVQEVWPPIAATMLVFSTDLLEIAAFNGLVVQNVSDRTICAIF